MIRNPYNPIPHDTPDIIRKCGNNTSWQNWIVRYAMMAKNEEIILHLAFLLFQLYIGLNEIKPVIMVLDHQRQLPACSPHSLIRAFVTIHLFDSYLLRLKF